MMSSSPSRLCVSPARLIFSLPGALLFATLGCVGPQGQTLFPGPLTVSFLPYCAASKRADLIDKHDSLIRAGGSSSRAQQQERKHAMESGRFDHTRCH
jgi:hypothetical protein